MQPLGGGTVRSQQRTFNGDGMQTREGNKIPVEAGSKRGAGKQAKARSWMQRE